MPRQPCDDADYCGLRGHRWPQCGDRVPCSHHDITIQCDTMLRWLEHWTCTLAARNTRIAISPRFATSTLRRRKFETGCRISWKCLSQHNTFLGSAGATAKLRAQTLRGAAGNRLKKRFLRHYHIYHMVICMGDSRYIVDSTGTSCPCCDTTVPGSLSGLELMLTAVHRASDCHSVKPTQLLMLSAQP